MDAVVDALATAGGIRMKGSGINTFTTDHGVGMMADLTMWDKIQPGMRCHLTCKISPPLGLLLVSS